MVPFSMPSRRGLPYPFLYAAGSPADRRSDFALPRNSVSSSSSSSWMKSRTCARACVSSVSQTGLDVASLLPIFLDIGGGSFRVGHKARGVCAPERCHRLQLISTPFEVSSAEGARRILIVSLDGTYPMSWYPEDHFRP